MSMDNLQQNSTQTVQETYVVKRPLSPGGWLAVWGLLAGVGLAVWLAALLAGDPQRAWLALLVNFLYVTSLAGGLTVWPAIVHSSNGAWAGHFERLAAAGLGFAPVSLLALAVLWLGSPQWSPWYGRELVQGFWLDNSFVFARDLLSLAGFWIAAAIYFQRRRVCRGRVAGPVLLIIYAVVFSLLGFDLVMALTPDWHSALFGGYFFISALYIGVAAWTLLSVFQFRPGPDRLQDFGRLIFAFAMLTTYCMFSQLLPIWYENLPGEKGYVIARLNLMPWRALSFVLLAWVYVGPLVMLLTVAAKRSRASLGVIAAVILAGMWAERWWLVMPSFSVRSLGFGGAGFAAALGGLVALLGALGLAMTLMLRRMPVLRPESELEPSPAEREVASQAEVRP